MEDAYTIGIRLALDDGVSAGIAAISGDLATLDRAVAATTGSLARLTAFAGDATHAAAAELQRFARQAEQFSKTPQPPTADTPPSPALPRRTIDTPPPVAAPAGAAPGAAPRIDISAPPSPTPSVRIVAPPPAAAPVVRILAPAPSAGYSPTPISPPTAQPPLAGFAPPPPPRDQPPPPTAAPSFDVQQHFVTNKAPSAALLNAAAAPQPFAPTSPATPPPPAATAPVEPYMPSMAPPPQAQASGAPSHGDVFLDGMRVGRWMSDNLAREATRPQSGSTAFDPRLGPAWPGTLQGN